MNINIMHIVRASGASCQSSAFSYSYVNSNKKEIIFRTWKEFSAGSQVLILDEDWRHNRAARKSGGFKEARENIRLIEEEGYSLKIFHFDYETRFFAVDDLCTCKLVAKVLHAKYLVKVGGQYFACDRKSILDYMLRKFKYLVMAFKRRRNSRRSVNFITTFAE